MDNTKDEILNSIIEFNNEKKIETINYEKLKIILNEKKIIKNIKNLMIRNTSKYFIDKNF